LPQIEVESLLKGKTNFYFCKKATNGSSFWKITKIVLNEKACNGKLEMGSNNCFNVYL
jgi:hypothetical protein